MPKKKTTAEFISDAQLVHTDVDYDYSKVVYVNNHTKVIIIDPIYGEFPQTPNKHLSGSGHRERGNQKIADNQRSSVSEFIAAAKLVHTDVEYDYSKVVYVGSMSKVLIIDPIYGEFPQTPAMHLSGNGNPDRGIQKRADAKRSSTSEFITDAKLVHTDVDYDYSKVVYVNNHTKVIIIDPIYGEFPQTPNKHLSGSGHPGRAIGGFKPNKPAILYLISLRKYGVNQQKVGITEKAVTKRFSQPKRINFKSYTHVNFELGEDALLLEQLILSSTEAHTIQLSECLIPNGDGISEIRTGHTLQPYFDAITELLPLNDDGIITHEVFKKNQTALTGALNNL